MTGPAHNSKSPPALTTRGQAGPDPVSVAHPQPALSPLTPAIQPRAIPVEPPDRPAKSVPFPRISLQRTLAIGSTNDPLEAEADRIADRVLGNSAASPAAPVFSLPSIRRQPASAIGPRSVEPVAAPPIVHEVLNSPGRPLDHDTRAFFEPRFGRDLGSVRIHTGAQAHQSARSVNALAFTVGPHAVFADGKFNPRSPSGKRLLAHELAHTFQQSQNALPSRGVPTQSVTGILQRQPNGQQAATGPLPSVQVPGTGITVIPGPTDPTTLAGITVPLPSSLRLTNALSTGREPSYVADIAPRRLVLTLLDGIDLSTSTRPGTPPNAAPSAENQSRIRLLRPVLSFDTASRTFRGHATLSIPSDYGEAFKGPTELDVDISSTELGQFNGSVAYGPLHADFSMRLHYQTDRLEQALAPAFRPQGGFAGFWDHFQQILRSTVPGIRLDTYSAALQSLVNSFQAGQIRGADLAARTAELIASSLPPNVSAADVRTAVDNFAREITHPGFTVQGTAGLGPLSLTSFRADAPTTVPIQHPLPGAPANYPIDYHAAGVVIAPAGAVTQTPVPAFGVTGASFNERRGISGTAAILPTLNPTATQGLVTEFPTYAYAEVSYVRRISRDLDMGVRLTLQVNSAELFGPRATPSADPAARLSQSIQNYQTAAAQTPGADTGPPANVGISIFGRFNGP